MIQPADYLPSTPLWARPFIAADALVFYLRKLVYPLNLAFDYGRMPQVVLQQGITYALWIIPVAMVLPACIWKRHRRWLLTAMAVFALGMLPVLGLTSFFFQFYSTVADRYVYLSMLAPALLLAYLLGQYSGRISAISCVGLIVLFGTASVRQVGFWKDTPALFEHAIEVNPRSYIAHHNLANYFTRQGDLRRSADELAIALDIVDSMPSDARKTSHESHNALGLVLMSQQRYPQAVRQFELMLRLDPGHAEAAKNLQLAREKLTPIPNP